MKKPLKKDLTVPSSTTSLNKTGVAVAKLQEALSYLGYEITEDEYKTQKFGKSTIAAVRKYQSESGLVVNGNYDSRTRKKLTDALVARKPGLIAKGYTHVITGSVFSTSGNPVKGATVRVIINHKGRLTTASQQVYDSGFYRVSLNCPKDSNGKAPINCMATITVIDSFGRQIYIKTITVRQARTWVNFGRKFKDPEYQVAFDKISSTFGICDVPGLLAPYEKSGIGAIVSATGLDRRIVTALAIASRIQYAARIKSGGKTNLPLDILYGLVRNSVPADMESVLVSADPKCDRLFSMLESDNEMMLDKVSDKNNTMLLEKLLACDNNKIDKAIVDAAEANIINHGWVNCKGDALKAIGEYRCNYFLNLFTPYGSNLTLCNILETTTVPKSEYNQIASLLSQTASIDGDFVEHCRLILSKDAYASLARSIDVFTAVDFDKMPALKIFTHIKGYHVSKMVSFEQEWADIEVKDVRKVEETVRGMYPDEWFVVYLDHVFGGRKDALAQAIKALMKSIFVENEAKRFIFSDMTMTGKYDFSGTGSQETNESLRKEIRMLQRMYKITRNPSEAADLISKGITSAVSAYYMIKNGELSVKENIKAAIEDIYWKAVNLYNDIKDASRQSNGIIYSNSANLRSLFGSIDSYIYDECLTLLDTPAYLADILRFLSSMKGNGQSAYNVLVSRRPDIAKIKLNTDNSTILVPQIDLTCEILESRISSQNWSEMQTSDKEGDPLVEPQYTNAKVYATLDGSNATVAHPYFSLPQTQTSALLEAIGMPRYKLMELFGAPEALVAGEYFGLSKKEHEFLDNTKASSWSSQINVSGTSGGSYSMPMAAFLNCAGLEYDEGLAILKALGIDCHDADPEGLGFPDIEKQKVWFNDKDATLSRLQRLIIICKRTGMAPEDVMNTALEANQGALDSMLLVALMDAARAEEDEDDILDEYFSKEEAAAALAASKVAGKATDKKRKAKDADSTAVKTSIGVIDFKKDESEANVTDASEEDEQTAPAADGDICAVVASEKGTAQENLELVSAVLKLDETGKDEKIAILRAFAAMDSCLELTVGQTDFIIRHFGSPATWTADMLREMATIIRFDKTYTISGMEPIVAVPSLSAGKCEFAESLKGYMDLTGIMEQDKLERWAHIEDYQQETAKSSEILDLARKMLTSEALKKAMDKVRVAKRDALIGYLLAGRQYFGKSADDIYADLLVDPRMGPEQNTTRITLATSSVQLFVQRCLLNLEPGVTVTADDRNDKVSTDSWSQWSWMKNYRVWEANRKIFLFPENWIDAELRDDRTPEFQDFLNEISQNEATEENMEEAVANYLYGLDDIANLEVCGVYRQKEDNVDICHVVARSKNSTPAYYYRSYDNIYEEWSAWEKIDIEMEGDQIVPVVYNRRLYIFWLVFVEKTIKIKKLPGNNTSEDESDAPEPANYYEIQLAWTYRKGNEWKPQVISRQKLIHPWERPRSSYDMKPYLDNANRLHLDLYLTKSEEFNNKQIPEKAFNYYPGFECRYTTNRYEEASAPWHSSSFVFEGDVTHIFLKDKDHNGVSSLNFVRNNFGDDGAAIEPLEREATGPMLILPEGMHMQNGRLCNNRSQTVNKTNLSVIEVMQEMLDKDRITKAFDELYASKLTTTTSPEERARLKTALNGYREYLSRYAASSRVLLSGAKGPFELVISQQNLQMNAMQKKAMMFYQDKCRSFCFETSEVSKVVCGMIYNDVTMPAYKTGKCSYTASLFYHPYVKAYVKALRTDGLDGLYDRTLQLAPWKKDIISRQNGEIFADYKPSESIINSPVEETDFSLKGSYSKYNWELFFHIPLTVACRLSANRQYEDAMKWFHYIFNPMDYRKGADSPECFWITRPFYENALAGKTSSNSQERIESILLNLTKNNAQLTAWKNNPYKPHIVAKYRTVAYQKAVVMKYIENLIAWADDKFREDTMESINEATLLYVLAYEILGKRPQRVPAPDLKEEELCYDELRRGIDAMGNSKKKSDRSDLLVYAESLLDLSTIQTQSTSKEVPTLDVFYFDVPENENLEEYWDTVEDRLRKIRASLNIDGVFRNLDIKAPEIDPGALVLAAAGGGGLADAMTASGDSQPLYKFRTVIQMAEQLCGEVKTMGDKLLSVLEKRDAEELAVMRTTYEHNLLAAQVGVNKKEIDEIKHSIKSLEYNLARAERNQAFYEEIEAVSAKEEAAIKLSQESLSMTKTAIPINAAGSALSAAGTITTGAEGVFSTPVCEYSICFQGMGQALQITANGIQMNAGYNDRKAGIISTTAAYERRKAEWALQAELAGKEVLALQSQIDAANVRLEMAEMQLELQKQLVGQTEAMVTAMKDKFTNEKLYTWMQTQISKVYYGAFNMAYDLAMQAEKCYKYEIGEAAGVIKAGSWTSAKKGLLAGDLLMQQILQLKKKYIESNVRNLEIIKRIPLSSLPSGDGGAFGSALLDLIYDGGCTIRLPESLFDMDYPKHYMRRIKSVSLSIPCVVGPNTNVNATLRLLKDATRMDNSGKPLEYGSVTPSPSIATSSGINDSGLFEVNFNDERYLPFEGYGAVSVWRIDLPKESNHFDRSSISDVILNVCYTAKEDNALEVSHGKTEGQEMTRVISLKHDFGAEWRKLCEGRTEVTFNVPDNIYPYIMRSYDRKLKTAWVEKPESKKSTYLTLAGEPGLKASLEDGVMTVSVSGSRIVDDATDIILVISCIREK